MTAAPLHAQAGHVQPGVLYSTLLGGSGGDRITGIATDSSGATYVVAETLSSDFPVTVGSYDTTYNGQEDIAVVKIDAAGRLVYSTYIGGAGTEHPIGLAVDDQGRAYVVGLTFSTDFPATGGTPAGDAFILELSPSGSGIVFSTRFGGSGLDEPTAVTVAHGTACVAGITYSPDFPTTPGAFSRTYTGGFYANGFLATFAGDGTLLAGTYFGGSTGENVAGVAVDYAGSVYVTGDTRSDDFPTTPGAWQRFRTVAAGVVEPFVMKFTPSGSLLYSTYLGGAGNAGGVAVDAVGQAVAVGRALVGLSPFPTTGSTAPPAGGGLSDAYVVKLDSTGGTVLFSTLLGGSAEEYVRGVALAEDGNVWVAGSTTSSDFPTTGGAVDRMLAKHLAPQGTYGFAECVSADGTALTSGTYIGSRDSNWTYPFAIAVDVNGFVHVAGETNGAGFPVTHDALQRRQQGSTDGFLVVFNPGPGGTRARAGR